MKATYEKTDFNDLARRLAQQAEAVAQYLFPRGHREGKEWCVANVSGEYGGSLSVCMEGPKKGVWHDFGTSERGGDLVELWARVRANGKKGPAADEIRSWLGGIPSSSLASPRPTTVQKNSSNQMKKTFNRDYHNGLVARLKNDTKAQAYLAGRGLDEGTIAYFGLGLTGPYTHNDVTTDSILTAPMINEEGEFVKPNAFIAIPGVSVDPKGRRGWQCGHPCTYWAQKREATHRILFICEGLKDVWRQWQGLKLAGLTDEIMLVSSSHGSVYPEEWKDSRFWMGWEKVYLGQDNDDPDPNTGKYAGDEIARGLLPYLGREALRVRTPKEFGKDWTDFWQNGGNLDIFRALLSQAVVECGSEVQAVDGWDYANMGFGSYTYKPIDINGAYVRGHLYYPAQIWTIVPDEKTGLAAEELQNIVVRSDGTRHHAIYAHALPGTPLNKRVLKLTDGTPIKKEPVASDKHSWTYDSIQAYLNGTARVRPLQEILREILQVLTRAIWLPYPEDYIALLFAVPATYVQEIFESVPYVLMVGPPGTGKTQAGIIMSNVCANGRMVGQISAATACRLIDETRGFVAFDDLEGIAERESKDVVASEFLQGLKVSYTKSSAVKRVTNVKTMNGEDLRFFGIKLFTNTTGIESILGTRTIRINTREMPKGESESRRRMNEREDANLDDLRNELHCWAFQNVALVDKTYREVFAQKSDRLTEIGAPLRTMARLANSPEWTAKLEAVLAKQQHQTNSDDPSDILKEAVHNLIRQGYTTASISHVRLEMRTLLDANYGMRTTNEIPQWDQPEWLGRKLRSCDFIEDVDLGRRRLWGRMLRLIQFKQWVVNDAAKNVNGELLPVINKAPDAFCQGCATCPYRHAGCEFAVGRQSKEVAAGKSLSSIQ